MKQLTILARSDLVNGLHKTSVLASPARYRATYRGVQIYENGARDVFPVASLGEESLVGSSLCHVLCIGVRTAIRLEPMLQKVSAAASVSLWARRRNWVALRTVPRRCCPTGHRPGRYGGGRSVVRNCGQWLNFDYPQGVKVGCFADAGRRQQAKKIMEPTYLSSHGGLALQLCIKQAEARESRARAGV